MSRETFGTQSSRVVWVLALLAGLLLTRPYMGLYHDALLYAAQALAAGGATALAEDLFFKFGNQGAFVLFPTLQAMVIDQIGLGPAMMAARAAASLVWLLGLAHLARTIYPQQRQWLVAMGLVVLLFAGYGNAALSYGEAFVTPRPFAEGFGMLALSLALRDKVALGAVAGVVALALHPLVGLSVAPLWVMLALGPSLRLFAWLGVGLGAVALAAAQGIAPATWLFQAHQGEWAELLKRYESLGFVQSWGLTPLRLHALALVTLVLACFSHDRLIGTFARTILTVTAIMVAVSVLGADLLGNRLIAALQPWRALAWLALGGHLLALHILLTHRPGRPFAVIYLLALAANVTEHVLHIIPLFSAALAALVILAAMTNRPGRGWRWINALWALSATLVVFGLASYIYLDQNTTPVDKTLRLAAALLVAIAFALPGRGWAGLFALIAAFLAIQQFDRRSPKLQFVESGHALPPALVAQLDGKVTYWEGGLEYMWITLRQPQFYSCQQRAGTLFYPEQAIEHERRGRLLSPLNTTDFTLWPAGSCPPPADADAHGPQNAAAVRAVCAAVPELQVLVLNHDVQGIETTRHKLPHHRNDRHAGTSEPPSVFAMNCPR